MISWGVGGWLERAGVRWLVVSGCGGVVRVVGGVGGEGNCEDSRRCCCARSVAYASWISEKLVMLFMIQ